MGGRIECGVLGALLACTREEGGHYSLTLIIDPTDSHLEGDNFIGTEREDGTV